MKWIKRKLVNWLSSNEMDTISTCDMKSGVANRINMDRALTFSVLPATGGCVVEIRNWDQKDHVWISKAHIIPNGEDIAHCVGQIVAIEFLRR
jgi:hypothetical protein